jgi:hypothetical protein
MNVSMQSWTERAYYLEGAASPPLSFIALKHKDKEGQIRQMPDYHLFLIAVWISNGCRPNVI